MNKTQISGTITGIKVLKEGVGKNKDGKFIKVVLNGNDEYVTFDTKFLDAEGLSGNFPTYSKEYNGKVSRYIELPEIQKNVEPMNSKKNLNDAIETLYEIENSLDSIKNLSFSVRKVLQLYYDAEYKQ